MKKKIRLRWTWAISALICAVLCLMACEHRAPTQPTSASLAGQWTGALTERAPCVGDWSSFVLTLQAAGVGEIVTKDGSRFAVSEVIENGVVQRLDVPLPVGPGECQTMSFVVAQIEQDAAGVVRAFSGQTIGRCCGTIMVPYRLARA